MSIAQKEARETKYWLRLLKDSGLFHIERLEDTIIEVDEIIKILFSIVKSSKK